MFKARILHVLDMPLQASGVATHVLGLIKLQREQGYDAQAMVLVDSHDVAPSEFAIAGFPKTFDLLQGWRMRQNLLEKLQHLNPDLIHLHAGFTTISPILVRTFTAFAPTVGTLHDVRPFCFHADRWQRPWARSCIRLCGWGCFRAGCYTPISLLDAAKKLRIIATGASALLAWQALAQILVPSRYMQELALQHGFPPETLSLIPNWTETASIQASISAKTAKPVIVYMGRLTPEKGVLTLLDALHQLRNQSWQAIFIGDGLLREALTTKITEYGLQDRVVILTQTDSMERSLILSRALMLVMPSLLPESFGLSGLEALAHGVPVVSFALGGITEWLHDQQTGLVAQLTSSEELVKPIRRLLDDPALAAQLGKNGLELVRRDFSTTLAIQKLVKIYDRLINT